MLAALSTIIVRGIKAQSAVSWLGDFLYLPEVLYVVMLVWLLLLWTRLAQSGSSDTVFARSVNHQQEAKMALSFATDIRPLFRDGDIECMGPSGVKLDDPAWMRVPANARKCL